MVYAECDKCGKRVEDGKPGITTVSLNGDRNRIQKDLCEKCYKTVIVCMEEVYPKSC